MNKKIKNLVLNDTAPSIQDGWILPTSKGYELRIYGDNGWTTVGSVDSSGSSVEEIVNKLLAYTGFETAATNGGTSLINAINLNSQSILSMLDTVNDTVDNLNNLDLLVDSLSNTVNTNANNIGNMNTNINTLNTDVEDINDTLNTVLEDLSESVTYYKYVLIEELTSGENFNLNIDKNGVYDFSTNLTGEQLATISSLTIDYVGTEPINKLVAVVRLNIETGTDITTIINNPLQVINPTYTVDSTHNYVEYHILGNAVIKYSGVIN